MKSILSVLFCLLTFASAYASGGRKETKSKENVKINIHIDKKGAIQIDGSTADEKEIEEWVNKRLHNISIQISDSSRRKTKNIELSLTIKEK